MKSIVQYIKEEYDKFVVTNLKVVFDIFPEEFYLNAPTTYSESDIQIYIGDSLLEHLPSENDKYQKLLGKNKDNISDAYFEYDKFEHLQDSDITEYDLKWDEYYDEKKNNELDVFKLTKLKYIILFDEFELMNDNDNIEKVLNEIFRKLDSSNINKYPVEIKYNEKLLEYDEQE